MTLDWWIIPFSSFQFQEYTQEKLFIKNVLKVGCYHNRGPLLFCSYFSKSWRFKSSQSSHRHSDFLFSFQIQCHPIIIFCRSEFLDQFSQTKIICQILDGQNLCWWSNQSHLVRGIHTNFSKGSTLTSVLTSVFISVDSLMWHFKFCFIEKLEPQSLHLCGFNIWWTILTCSC